MLMSHAVMVSPSCFATASGSNQPRKRPNSRKPGRNPAPESISTTTTQTISLGVGSKKKHPLWQCVSGCGACCKLHKGPFFPSPEEIFDDPSDVQLYKSLIGQDGWCVHFEKSTRRCSIYSDRPYFCRVEPDVFQTLYGIEKKKFNKAACSCCVDTIKAVYGSKSKELDQFNQEIWSSSK